MTGAALSATARRVHLCCDGRDTHSRMHLITIEIVDAPWSDMLTMVMFWATRCSSIEIRYPRTAQLAGIAIHRCEDDTTSESIVRSCPCMVHMCVCVCAVWELEYRCVGVSDDSIMARAQSWPVNAAMNVTRTINDMLMTAFFCQLELAHIRLSAAASSVASIMERTFISREVCIPHDK